MATMGKRSKGEASRKNDCLTCLLRSSLALLDEHALAQQIRRNTQTLKKPYFLPIGTNLASQILSLKF